MLLCSLPEKASVCSGTVCLTRRAVLLFPLEQFGICVLVWTLLKSSEMMCKERSPGALMNNCLLWFPLSAGIVTSGWKRKGTKAPFLELLVGCTDCV